MKFNIKIVKTKDKFKKWWRGRNIKKTLKKHKGLWVIHDDK